MKSLSLLFGLVLLAPAAWAQSDDVPPVTEVQQGTLVEETEDYDANGDVVRSKIFRFKAYRVGSCVFGRETVTVKRSGSYTDIVKANGDCRYNRSRPVCNLKATLTLTDRSRNRIKRWKWERDVDWADNKGGKPVKIEDESKLLKKNFRSLHYAVRRMQCRRTRG